MIAALSKGNEDIPLKTQNLFNCAFEDHIYFYSLIGVSNVCKGTKALGEPDN